MRYIVPPLTLVGLLITASLRPYVLLVSPKLTLLKGSSLYFLSLLQFCIVLHGLGIGHYTTEPQFTAISTDRVSSLDITTSVQTNMDITRGSDLILGENGTISVNVTLTEGTARVKIAISKIVVKLFGKARL